MGEQAKAVKHIRGDDPIPELYFPTIFGDNDGIGGNPVVDPLMIYILPMGGGYEEFPAWSLSLADMLKYEIEVARKGDDSYSEGLRKIADAMDKLAKHIRDACTEGENNYAKISA